MPSDASVRVAFLTQVFPRYHGDHHVPFLRDLALGLGDARVEVLVLAPHQTGLRRSEQLWGLEVRRFRYGPERLEVLAYRGEMHDLVLRRPLVWPILAGFMVSFVRAARTVSEEVDLFHAHWWIPAGLAGALARPSCPLVITCHGSDLYLLDRLPALRALARWVFKRAQRVTVVSSPLRERVAILTGRPAETIPVLPMPVDLERFLSLPLPLGPPWEVLFVGRLIQRKGPDLLLQAAALMAERPIRFTLIGEGPERERLERLIVDLKLESRVRLLGSQAPESVAELLAQSHLLALPARRDWKGEEEGLGMVLLEAMARGRPVVTTPTGGIPDAVRDGETGLLVPPDDPAALAEAIAYLLDNPGVSSRLAAQGRRWVEEHASRASAGRRYAELYREAVAGSDLS